MQDTPGEKKCEEPSTSAAPRTIAVARSFPPASSVYTKSLDAALNVAATTVASDGEPLNAVVLKAAPRLRGVGCCVPARLLGPMQVRCGRRPLAVGPSASAVCIHTACMHTVACNPALAAPDSLAACLAVPVPCH